MSRPALPHTTDPDSLMVKAAELCRRRADAELQLLVSVYGNPARAVAVATLAGVGVASFSQVDHQCLWVTAAAHHAFPTLDAMALAAKRLLLSAGLWTDAEGPGGGLWSAERLADLVWPSGHLDAAVRIDAERLADLDQRIARLTDLIGELGRVVDLASPLEGRPDAPRASPVVAILPNRRHAHGARSRRSPH